MKIGRTTNLEQRLRLLDNTSVPLPFRCVYAVEVDDENDVERLLHQAFADNRTRTTREFFEVDAQRVIAAMKLGQCRALQIDELRYKGHDRTTLLPILRQH